MPNTTHVLTGGPRCLCLCVVLSRSLSCVSVPAPVSHLKGSNQNMTDSLWFSWSPALGDLDFYELILYNPNGTKKENWRHKDLTEWRFHGLVPGRKYTLCVVTHSGDLSNQVTGEGRTGKKPKHRWPDVGRQWLCLSIKMCHGLPPKCGKAL